MKFFMLTLMFLSLSVLASGEKKMKIETAYLAGGCFWGMEELIRSLPGVVGTEVGYSGGDPQAKSYEIIKLGKTGQSEAVKIDFDTSKTTFSAILDFFFRIHDPTTLNQQGNDKGTQYRSAIFYVDENQQKIAQQVKEKVGVSGKWKNPIVTEITKFTQFNKAEDYHQDYLQKNPTGYTCHWIR